MPLFLLAALTSGVSNQSSVCGVWIKFGNQQRLALPGNQSDPCPKRCFFQYVYEFDTMFMNSTNMKIPKKLQTRRSSRALSVTLLLRD